MDHTGRGERELKTKVNYQFLIMSKGDGYESIKLQKV